MPRPVRAPGVQPLRKLPLKKSPLQPRRTYLECNKSEKFQHEWETTGNRHRLILSSVFCGRVLDDEGPAPLTKPKLVKAEPREKTKKSSGRPSPKNKLSEY